MNRIIIGRINTWQDIPLPGHEIIVDDWKGLLPHTLNTMMSEKNSKGQLNQSKVSQICKC